MAGYQFGHMGTYSRKGNSVGRSIRQVCDEAGRAEGAAPHVEHPEPPVILDGCDPREIPAILEGEIEAAKAERSGGRGGGIRRDTHSLEGMVLSYPVPWERINADPAEKAKYEAWRADAARWGKVDQDRRGVETKSTVEHRDEKQPHVHVLGIPRNARKDAKATHPGHAAAGHAKSQGGDAQAQKRAYRESMRTWQDTMHNELGAKHGQARTGPGRTRQTRDQWQATQREAERMAERAAKLDRVDELVEQRAADLAKSQQHLIVETAKREIADQLNAANADLEAQEAELNRRESAIEQARQAAEAAVKREKVAAKEARKAEKDAADEAANARILKAEAQKLIDDAPARAEAEIKRLTTEAVGYNQRAAAYSGAMVAGLEAYAAGHIVPGRMADGSKGFGWPNPAVRPSIEPRIRPAWEAVWDACHRVAERGEQLLATARDRLQEAGAIVNDALRLKEFLPAAQRAQAEALVKRQAAAIVPVPEPRRRAQHTL